MKNDNNNTNEKNINHHMKTIVLCLNIKLNILYSNKNYHYK